jgi:hypothetical protein
MTLFFKDGVVLDTTVIVCKWMLDVTGKHAGSLFLKNGMDRHQLFLLVYSPGPRKITILGLSWETNVVGK